MNHRPRPVTVLAVCGLLVTLVWLLGLRLQDRQLPKRRAAIDAEASRSAFNESYLDAATGHDTTRRRPCSSCHATADAWNSSPLGLRAALTRQEWAREISLPAKCGLCHLVPDPSNLSRQSWREVMSRMDQIMGTRGVPKLDNAEFQDVLHFYFTFSPEAPPQLAADPDPRESPLKFEPIALGNPPSRDSRDHPFLGHVQIADLDQDGQADVLVSDTGNSALTWIHRQNKDWREETLASLPNPAHTQVFAGRVPGALDIVVGCLGTTSPTDDPVGSVVLLDRHGTTQRPPLTILDHVARVADVEPGDFDGDGDIDFVVAAYGFINQGEVGWLERRSDETYRYHPIAKKTGAVNVLPVDIDGDGRLDFIALFAQEHEEISAFINDGQGQFSERVLFKAATPAFGSSGMQLVDLDQDGDVDILFTNGDNLDLPTITPRPYHGVQWLENRGNLDFVWHDIYRCYGAYCAAAGDLNKDGHLDIVVTTLFNDWSDPKRASLLWLENDGHQRFVPHSIATRPTHLISAAIADIDGDGWLDIVTCGMYGFPPYDRMARVTLWRNQHE